MTKWMFANLLCILAWHLDAHFSWNEGIKETFLRPPIRDGQFWGICHTPFEIGSTPFFLRWFHPLLELVNPSASGEQLCRYSTIKQENCWIGHIALDEEKNRYVARDQLLYGLDSCQESLIWHQREVTWEQGPIRALVSIT